jgi:hypothetical protein
MLYANHHIIALPVIGLSKKSLIQAFQNAQMQGPRNPEP